MLKFIKEINECLKINVNILQSLIYFLAIIIISVGIVQTVIVYFKEIYLDNILPATIDARIIIGESITLSLSFILGIEVLRTFYIRTFQQFFIIGAILFLRQFITYFLDKEVEFNYKKRKEFSNYKNN